jgi:exodeoxyribonuclease V alpha subunit
MTLNKAPIQAKVEVQRIMHRNEKSGFTIFRAKLLYYSATKLPSKVFVASGLFPSIQKGDEFEGQGHWEKHKSYGYRFAFDSYHRNYPETDKGFIKFLTSHIKGVGPTLAKKIINTFGVDVLEAIKQDPNALLRIPGMNQNQADRITSELRKHQTFDDIAMFVLNHGLPLHLSIEIYDKFGDLAIGQIMKNPYLLCDLPSFSFREADLFAKERGIPFDFLSRVKAGILYYMEWDVESKGNLYTEESTIYAQIEKFLLKEGAFSSVPDQQSIANVVIADGLQLIRQEQLAIVDSTKWYLPFYYRVENEIIRYLSQWISHPSVPVADYQEIEEAIRYFEQDNGFKLSQKQKDSVHMALTENFSILTGLPGTGKTQTIRAILYCIKRLRPFANVTLCAPTGKASQRMTELTGEAANTIHYTTGLNPFDRTSPVELIDSDLTIVDESSMVDAYVFSRLLEATQGRLLLVGDPEQLPSVGPGLILRDLLNSGIIPNVRLTEIYRQAQTSQIVNNAHCIIHGYHTTDKNGPTFDETKGDAYFIEESDISMISRRVIETIRRAQSEWNVKLEDIQVLSPTHIGDAGVWRLNQDLQATFNPKSTKKMEVSIDHYRVLREGDRVVQTKNNRILGVVNGETGIIDTITSIDGELTIIVRFRVKEVYYGELDADELTLAYAMTVHKSQGSEFPVVLMIVHRAHRFMLTRNSIYTAMTRATKVNVFIGTKSALDAGIDKQDNFSRLSGIKEKLIKLGKLTMTN